MANEASQVRIVRCPKCQQLLTEFAHIPLYTCGGCGVVLQAKKRGGRGGSSSCMKYEGSIKKSESKHEDEKLVASGAQTVTFVPEGRRSKSRPEYESPSCEGNMTHSTRNCVRISISEIVKCNGTTEDAVGEIAEEPKPGHSESTVLSSQTFMIPSDACIRDTSHGKGQNESETADCEDYMSRCSRNKNHISISEELEDSSEGVVVSSAGELESEHEDDGLIASSRQTITIAIDAPVTDTRSKKDRSADNEEKMSHCRRLFTDLSVLEETKYSTEDAEREITEEPESRHENNRLIAHGRRVLIIKDACVQDASCVKGELESESVDCEESISQYRRNFAPLSVSEDIKCNSKDAVSDIPQGNKSVHLSSQPVKIAMDACAANALCGNDKIESELAESEKNMSQSKRNTFHAPISEELCNRKDGVSETVEEIESDHEDNRLIASSSQVVTAERGVSITDASRVQSWHKFESPDCEENTSQCRTHTKISISEELECQNKDAVALTAAKSNCFWGRTSVLAISDGDSRLASMDLYSNVLSSSDDPNEVMTETRNEGEDSDLNQVVGCNPDSFLAADQVSLVGLDTKNMPVKQPELGIQMKIDKSAKGKQVGKDQKLSSCGSDSRISYDETEGDKEPPNYSTLSEENIIDEKADSAAFKILCKSPTTKSSHAYYGSVTSHGDDWDDHVPDRRLQPLERTLLKPQGNADPSYNKRRLIRGSHSELQSERTKFPSVSNEKHVSASGGSNCWNKVEPSAVNGDKYQMQGSSEDPDVFHSVRSWVESESEVPYISTLKDPSNHRELPSAFKDVCSSNYGHQELAQSPSSNEQSLEHERDELLRKLEELRVQLQRSYRKNGKSKERFHSRPFPCKHQLPSCSGSESGQELLWYCNEKCPHGTVGIYGQWEAMPNQYGHSMMPPWMSSAQAMKCRHYVNHPHSRCFSQDWQYPGQLPSQLRSPKGPCRACSGHACFHCHSSSIASKTPQHADPIFCQPWHNFRPREQIEEFQVGKKHHAVKRHCRPMAGGAPFVLCNRCHNLLQLPADFLLSKTRHHKLRCGACSKVLLFSLNDSAHLLSSSPTHRQHFGSEAGHSTYTANGDLQSSSHVQGYLQEDPILYSDDYGPPTCKSHSTEGEHTLLGTSVPVSSRAPDEKDRASTSTVLKPAEGKKKLIFKQSGKNRGSPSSGPPLHRLMGYSSPTDLLYGSCSTGNGNGKSALDKVGWGSGAHLPVHQVPIPRTSQNCNEISEVDNL